MEISAEPRHRRRKARIALIEDDPSVLALERLVVDRLGYEVLTASDGEEGYRMIVEEQPDAVILDISLPGCNGLAVAHRLRHNLATQAIPVAFVTARREGHDFEQGFSAGGKLYLVKPFTNRALQLTVEMLLLSRPG